jgi:enamine deaminase RidA (YjgF/YER057c/UK114 family)
MPEFTGDVPGLCPAPEPYSYAVRTGSTVYLAGQVALDEQMNIVGTTMAEQAAQVWDNIERVLATCGSRLDHVVKINYFVQDIRDLPAEIAVRRTKFAEGRFPAVTAVQVAALGLPGLVMEVDIVAELVAEPAEIAGPGTTT